MKRKKRSNLARLARLRKRIDALAAATAGESGPAWDGALLKAARRALGITQTELADAMSIRAAAAAGVELASAAPRFEQPHVSRWERGAAPGADSLAFIVAVFRDRGAAYQLEMFK